MNNRCGSTFFSSARIFAVAWTCISLWSGFPALADDLRVFVADASRLERTKNRIFAHNDPLFVPAYQAAINRANSALNAGPWSVVDKDGMPPSGDKHDYMSIAPYWHPNPDTSNGLPYINIDGVLNEEVLDNTFDFARLNQNYNRTHELGVAYYYTGNEAYAERAALLLRTWFLDSATRMNPNMRYGQAIPGVVDGRDIGIIDSRVWIRLIDAVGMIESSPHWTAADQQGLQGWFSSYASWLKTPFAVAAQGRTNNHGTWYDAQYVAYTLFTKQDSLAQQQILNYTLDRINSQINSQGVQTHEVTRATPWRYSVFNLEAFFTVAQLAEHVGVDLWNYVSPNGRSIKQALDYLISFVDDPSQWSHGPLSEVNLASLNEMLLPMAYEQYGELKYLEAFQTIQGTSTDNSIYRLLYHHSIPEPTSLALLGTGALLMLRRRKR